MSMTNFVGRAAQTSLYLDNEPACSGTPWSYYIYVFSVGGQVIDRFFWSKLLKIPKYRIYISRVIFEWRGGGIGIREGLTGLISWQEHEKVSALLETVDVEPP